jgi:Helix-turn-helix domain
MIGDNLGPIINSDGLRFLDTPLMRAERARCLYLGKLTRERPKWLRDNPDNARPLTAAEQAALASPTEHAAEALAPVPSPALLSEARPNSTADVLRPQTENRPHQDEQSAPVMPPVVTSPQVPSTRDEIIIDGRPLLTQQDAAGILGASVRTLQRWHQKNVGPLQIKIGRRVYYDPDELTAWVSSNRTPAWQPELPTQLRT